jgi:hypothetical protein
MFAFNKQEPTTGVWFLGYKKSRWRKLSGLFSLMQITQINTNAAKLCDPSDLLRLRVAASAERGEQNS